jgi:PHD/YefM family antitoxin component YafN of YafNO toxin-antitoxin module
MNTVPAREIKRRGISAVDAALVEGPVHVIKDDRLAYVVLTEGQYEELVEGYHEASVARVKASLEEVSAGRTRRVTPRELMGDHQEPDV